MAIALAQEAVKLDEYMDLKDEENIFFLLPLEHSESLELYDWAEKYFMELDNDQFKYYEKKHRQVLEKFGRYPYQNEDLGRESTQEELEYLEKYEGNAFAFDEL